MPSKKKDPAASEPLSFEESLAELEQIVGRLEAGQIGLDESLAQYQLGVERLKHCHQLLGKAERRVRILQGLDKEENLVTESFDEGEMTLDEKSRNRGQRRTSDAKAPTARPRSAGKSVDGAEGLF